jgi:hypothetical protein
VLHASNVWRMVYSARYVSCGSTHIVKTCQTESLCDALVDFKDELRWFCRGCRGGVEKLLLVMAKLQARIDELEEEIIRKPMTQ